MRPRGPVLDGRARSPAGLVFDFSRSPLRDGSGIRRTIFLKGCSLSCRWCHNLEGQSRSRELLLRSARCIGCGAFVDISERRDILARRDGPRTDRSRCLICGKCAEVCYAEARAIVGLEIAIAEAICEVEPDRAFYYESGGGVTFSGGCTTLSASFPPRST